MGRGDLRRKRWRKDRQRKTKARLKRKAEAKGSVQA